jgi:NADH:ubiquinone oxidoreductase subunit 3 (subunit A)
MLFDLSVLLANTQASVGSYAKLTTYECGFLPFGDARQKYNLNFYLAGILFIVFDLELTLLLP